MEGSSIHVQRNIRQAVIFGLLFVFGVFSSGVFSATAAPLKGYEALHVETRGSMSFAPGEERTLELVYKNIGSKAWNRSDDAYVSLYTYGPKYRTSVFESASWFKKVQPARFDAATIKPTEIATLKLTLKAPKKTGLYAETFQLAAEDVAWIPGSAFTLQLTVVDAKTAATTAPAPTSAPKKPGPYTGSVLVRSTKNVTAYGGEVVSYTVGLLNEGTTAWQKRLIRVPDVQAADATLNAADLRHTSWFDPAIPIAKSDAPVKPGVTDLVTFQLTAPSRAGLYTARFQFVADDQTITDVEIPITVTSDAPELLSAPVLSEQPVAYQMSEPTLRVGVLIVDEETQNQVVVSCETDFDVTAGTGVALRRLPAGGFVTAYYRDGVYWYDDGAGQMLSTPEYLRFVPTEANRVCTITNFDRRVTRDGAFADNSFRNVLELRYNTAKNRAWIINELPMEQYLHGLAETSNISPMEYQKALVTAARTYALYHWERGTKHGKEFFHVDAYADQVYKGFGQEQRVPRVVQAVDETRGQIVTYENKTAITPYYSRSDGRTRAWSEVWYGSVPWLPSVPTPCDQGKVLWGHGVGLSASAALCMANQGMGWKDILSYFYVGTQLQARWP